ncbi:MAG: hypothetical protein ABJL54_12635 [Halioglobus sp.]
MAALLRRMAEKVAFFSDEVLPNGHCVSAFAGKQSSSTAFNQQGSHCKSLAPLPRHRIVAFYSSAMDGCELFDD